MNSDIFYDFITKLKRGRVVIFFQKRARATAPAIPGAVQTARLPARGTPHKCNINNIN
jgi:hypothetical protein